MISWFLFCSKKRNLLKKVILSICKLEKYKTMLKLLYIKIVACVFSLFFMNTILFAQDASKKDSLLNTILNIKDGEINKIEQLNKIGRKFQWSDLSRAQYFFQTALNISQEINNKYYISYTYNNLGVLAYLKGDYAKSLELHVKSLELKIEIKDKKGQAISYNNIGNLYVNESFINTGLRYYEKALLINKEIKNTKGIASNFNNIAMLLSEKGNYDKALKFLKQAVAINIEQKNDDWLANNYGNIGTIFLKQNNDSSLIFYQKRLLLNQKGNNLSGIAWSYHLMGDFYLRKNDFQKSIKYYKKSLNLINSLGNKIYNRNIYKNLSEIYEKQNDYKNAYKNIIKYKSLSDSVFSEENILKIARIKINYELLKNKKLLDKEHQNSVGSYIDEISELKSVRSIFILVIFVLIVIFLYFFNKNKINKKARKVLLVKNNEIREKNNLLRTQKTEIENKNKILKTKNLDLEKAYVMLNEQTQKIEQQKDELQKANSTKDKMFSIIGHDLRGPIGGFKTVLNILLGQYENFTEEKKIEILKRLNKTAGHTYNLLENLLDWARCQTDNLKYEPEYISIKEIVNENIMLLSDNAKAKNIELKATIEKDLPPDECGYVTPLFADRNMLNATIRNLLTNSIKFTDTNGRVTISAKEMTDYIQLSVQDTGIGISSENIAKIFDNNSQYFTVGTWQEKGSGLGLVLCKEFIQRNKGNLFIKSKENEGSTFSFTVPKKV